MSGPGADAPAVRLEGVTKTYGAGASRVVALDDLTLEIPRGQVLAVTGRSGSGKSTLLNLVAGIDAPTSGRVWVAGREIGALSDDELTLQRRKGIGMMHQFFHLLPTLSARENVALPALLAGDRAREVRSRADRLLAEVGMTARADARPDTLSGGEMQRVALARALIGDPGLVLADEPTGNLDSRSAAQVLGLLRDLAHRHRTTVVLVTHSAEAAGIAERVVELRDGRLAGDRAMGPPP